MEPFSEDALSYQIRHLKHVERLSATQIAKHLNVSERHVANILKEETSCPGIFRMRVEYLGQACENNAIPIDGWHRDIELGGDVTLNELNDIIQQVLGWDNMHLYAFAVNGKRYAYLGDDDYIIDDVFENHYSAKIQSVDIVFSCAILKNFGHTNWKSVIPEGFEEVHFWGVKRGIVECEEFKKIAPYGVASRKLRLFRRWAKAECRSMDYKWKWQGLGFTALNGRRFFDALMKLLE